MIVQVNNIEFNFSFAQHLIEPNDDRGSIFNLDIFIEPKMLKRFINECSWNDHKCLPHYDRNDMEHVDLVTGHHCYVPDTEIVLMNWLFAKKRKYKFDFKALDPYWLFHDSFHAQNDVYSSEVCPINSYIEYCRLIQGAEFAQSKGFSIMPHTVIDLMKTWDKRWEDDERNYQKFHASDMFNFMDEEDIEQVHIWDEMGSGPDQYYYDILALR